MAELTANTTGNNLPDASILADLDRLPAISTVVAEVLKITSSPTTSAADLARAIAKDPVLSARALRIANSGYFSLQARVATIQQAVVVLGMDLVRACTLSAAVTQVLKPTRLVAGFGLEAYWHHCACVACTAEDIARTTVSEFRQEAFTGGLLHDIGSLILACVVPDAYGVVLAEGRQTGRALRDVERRVFGIDHATLGAEAARRWQFPDVLVDMIAYHHSPAEAPAESAPLAAAVHIADAVAHGMGSAGCETAYAPRTDFKAWGLLGGLRTGMQPGEAERCAQKLQHQAESVEKLSRALLVA